MSKEQIKVTERIRMRLGHDVHYLTKSEEWTANMLDVWQRADKKDPRSLQRHLDPLLAGFDFMERNERANEFVDWGARLKREGNIPEGDSLIRLGSTIRPINPAPGCPPCVGG